MCIIYRPFFGTIQVALSKPCKFSGIAFSSGAASCQSGTQFRCEDGEWRGLGVPCAAGDSPIKVVPSGRTSMFNDATVASNSTICRSGTTYLCNDGEWMNLGTVPLSAMRLAGGGSREPAGQRLHSGRSPLRRSVLSFETVGSNEGSASAWTNRSNTSRSMSVLVQIR